MAEQSKDEKEFSDLDDSETGKRIHSLSQKAKILIGLIVVADEMKILDIIISGYLNFNLSKMRADLGKKIKEQNEKSPKKETE